MDKKNLIYVGVGVVVAYFLVSFMKKEKEKKEAEEKFLIDSIAEKEKAEKEKIDACNKSTEEFMAGRGKTRGEDVDAIRKAKFEECIKSKGI